jgi:hypothetical protein
MVDVQHDWFIREWSQALGKRQSDFVRDLEWNKSRASLLWNGGQPYTRDIVNEVAAYLKILPFELLMHPNDAMAVRRMRQSAQQIAGWQLAADVSRSWDMTGSTPPDFTPAK